jgi:hypothetical protein
LGLSGGERMNVQIGYVEFATDKYGEGEVMGFVEA